MGVGTLQLTMVRIYLVVSGFIELNTILMVLWSGSKPDLLFLEITSRQLLITLKPLVLLLSLLRFA